MLRKSLRSSTLGLLVLMAEEALDTREDWDNLLRGELNFRGRDTGESGNRPESLLLIPDIDILLLLPELPWPHPEHIGTLSEVRATIIDKKTLIFCTLGIQADNIISMFSRGLFWHY